MVFFALTRVGYKELVGNLKQSPSPLWVNAEVLTPEELAHLRQTGDDITVFSHAINVHDSSAIESAICTVQEHHAGQSIWVEYVADL